MDYNDIGTIVVSRRDLERAREEKEARIEAKAKAEDARFARWFIVSFVILTFLAVVVSLLLVH